MHVRKQAPFSYRDGWTENPSAAPGSIEAKAPDLDQGKCMLPVDRYYSRDFMALEWERMWTKV